MSKPTPGHPRRLRVSRKGLIRAGVIVALLLLVFLEDGPIRGVIKDLRVHAVLKLMHLLTWLGRGWVLGAEAIALYGIGRWLKRPELKQAGVRCLIAVSVAGAAVQVIKHLVGRPRPRLVDRGIVDWGPSFVSGHDSLPSGHTISAFAMAAVLSAFYPAGQWIWYALAVLVAFTRIYIDAHFPSDVFVGAVLGVLIGVWASRLKRERLKS
ncbi:MAG TPA: phosphatase PAP2 family protein [Nitrospiria bacterium]|nr:phosphatase PAP2 family protein [Nitrospiria bacterium]